MLKGGVSLIDIIYTVSPQYLTHIQKESEQFQFSIQGYGDFSIASSKLYTTNISNIIGFCILLEELPDDILDMVEFINKCNIIARDTPMVIASKTQQGFDSLFEHIEIGNLQVMIATGFEIVTDTLIKRDLFGGILKQKYSPYYLNYTPSNEEYRYVRNTTIGYTPLFSKLINLVLTDLYVADSYEKTIELDTCLEELSANPILYAIRMYLIAKRHSYKINEYQQDVLDKLEQVPMVGNKDYFVYKSLYSMVEGGLL